MPEVTVGLLERFGLANSNQRYFTVNPLEHAALLEAWGVDSARCFVFLRSALGALFASMDDDKILCLEGAPAKAITKSKAKVAAPKHEGVRFPDRAFICS